MSEVLILNSGPHYEETPLDAQIRLFRDINNLKDEFIDPGCGRIDYGRMSNSEAFLNYVADAAFLRHFDLPRVNRQEEKIALWLNIYNMLVIHGVIELGIGESVKEEPQFFRRFAYLIDNMEFTPEDIEHGVLRENRRPPYSLFHPFSSSDDRLKHVVDVLDARIHFALVRASVSSPSFRFYVAERLDEQLDLASSEFINSPNVEIIPERNLLRLSAILKWYRPDFGGPEGVIDLLVRYHDPGQKKDFLIEQGLAADVEWMEYDWRLNKVE